MARTLALKAAVRSGVRMSADTANLLRNLRRGRGACSAGQEVACISTWMLAWVEAERRGRWVPTSTSRWRKRQVFYRDWRTK